MIVTRKKAGRGLGFDEKLAFLLLLID